MIKNHHDLSAEERAEHESKWGQFNDYPPGWRELSQEAFARSSYFSQFPTLLEHRQMLRYLDGREHTGPCVSACLQFMPDSTGYAIVSEFWNKKIRIFAFGCAHEWGDGSDELKRRNIQRFAHDAVFYCLKCGHLAIHDSSD